MMNIDRHIIFVVVFQDKTIDLLAPIVIRKFYTKILHISI